MISVAPVEQVQQQELKVVPAFDRPPLHVPVPEIALADNTPGSSAPVNVSSTAPRRVGSPQAPLSIPRFDADYLDNPAPRYPPLSRRMREEGVVLVRVYVSPGEWRC